MDTRNKSVGMCRQFGCGVLALGLVTAGAVAAPALRIEWSINGGKLNVSLPDGVGLKEGMYGYQGTLTDQATGIELSYDRSSSTNRNSGAT